MYFLAKYDMPPRTFIDKLQVWKCIVLLTRRGKSRFRKQKSFMIFCSNQLDLLISTIRQPGGRTNE
uniref:Uncharacterized protein n=1 Tax=Anguilla anguilla TaxID=7936 RepID=A0A0E9X0G1_ANGAN